jgi:hypothetical protein
MDKICRRNVGEERKKERDEEERKRGKMSLSD